MKTILTTILILCASLIGLAQIQIIKTNVAGLAFQSLNTNYEYQTGPKTSVGMLIGYKLPSTIKVSAIADQSDGDEFRWQGEIEPKGLFINPYFRYYTKASVSGFYVEPFLRYYNYDFTVPYEYDKNSVTINANADGTANGIGGGFNIGTQIVPGNVAIDFFMGFGLAGGKIHVETNDPNLDESDYAKIKQTIEENTDTSVEIFVLGAILDKIKADANSTSAWADIEGVPFPILRAGISFGYVIGKNPLSAVVNP